MRNYQLALIPVEHCAIKYVFRLCVQDGFSCFEVVVSKKLIFQINTAMASSGIKKFAKHGQGIVSGYSNVPSTIL